MTIMTINGTVGADPVKKEIHGKNYYQISVAHRNGREDTTWVSCLFVDFGQEMNIAQGSRIAITGRPIFGCYEGRCTVTLWSDRYEVQF